jgi:hypothetical protein
MDHNCCIREAGRSPLSETRIAKPSIRRLVRFGTGVAGPTLYAVPVPEPAASHIVPMMCPLCDSSVVIVLGVDHVFRTVKAVCPECRAESFLAVPAMQSTYVNGHAARPTHNR